MSMCERLKAHLVLHGLEAVREHELYSTHLGCCPRCAAVAKAYAELPDLLSRLPEHEPDPRLVDKTRAGVSAETPRSRFGGSRRRRIAGGLAAALVAVAALGLFREVVNQRPDGWPPVDPPATVTITEFEVVADKVSAPGARERNETIAVGGLGSADAKSAPEPAPALESPARGRPALNLELKPGEAGEDLAAELGPGRYRVAREETLAKKQSVAPRMPAAESVTRPDYDARAAAREWAYADQGEAEGSVGAEPVPSKPDAAPSDDQSRANRDQAGPEEPAPERRSSTAGDPETGTKRVAASAPPADKTAAAEAGDPRTSPDAYRRKEVAQRPVETPEHARERQPALRTETGPDGQSRAGNAARKGGVTIENAGLGQRLLQPGDVFFGRYEGTAGLRFRGATGYWANTYVPGDPAIRLLDARLRAWDRTALAGADALEQAVAPYRQPFDPPTAAALALTVMADAGGIDGPTRMRVQVGIQGIEHRRGQRAAMNLGIVVDLPAGAGDGERIAVRALLDALLKSRQAGDRFTLAATGHGLLVAADQFRFGPLELAKRALLEPAPEAETPAVDLEQALDSAVAAVRAGDDPSRPLGTSAVLLITAAELPGGAALAALRDRVHARAADGITLSVVPLGNEPAADAVEALVLAGLGSRRVLRTPAAARALVEDELHAASRAVARAARLSIRLAPGVHLVDVIGSERLDEPGAGRVREIEKSLDLRLSGNLGIDADRGEDEDGIQIVIPSVYSGDSLVVLVDVVAERPGPIAEVSLRFKDLVFLTNGALHGQLSLPQGPPVRGPAELSVLKNLLAHHFVLAVEQAADALAGGDPAAAREALARIHADLIGVRGRVPGWENDPELLRDQRVLENYLEMLASPQAGAHRNALSDSLRYAAWRKTHRPPPEWQT